MSLNMYLGEVHTQTQSMNAVCTATIQGMEQAIQSIDAFAIDTVLQGQTYSSAKAFFAQTFRPLAQGIIYLCEELIRQNDAFPSQFQSQVASTDVIEQEILEQIRGIDRMRAGVEGISNVLPAMQAMMGIFDMMKRKLQEKLERLHEFNYTSSSNYDTALQLATSIATGLAEVQSGKGFSPTSGTFSTQGLNMEWATSIQAITEDRKRQADNLLNGSSIEEGAIDGKPSSESEEKGFDGKKLARDIAGEISGEYDVRRAWDGIDPSTGEKLSTWERISAGGMAVAGLTPVGKVAKIGKGVKMTAKAAEAANTTKKASKVDRSFYINSGGRNGSISVDEWFRRDAHAVKTYEEIRNSSSDVQSIVKNTGIHERHVSRAKEHVFFKKHDLGEQGYNRFDPDYPIAQGWKRLESGNFLKEDMDLLRHEIFESRFEGIFKTDYKTAHNATVRSGRPWEIPKIDKE
ncbi:pre-toxin TG domain-containing protein [Bacillus paramycoides]|uniref:pre-toxin TG domain-containing protein n=1 Tax=Bacillus paramycoides TaxID=2026194 RepID=UPI002E240B56|nr:pre-toxin TG domain-containing protein [Bacillus paramycoides]